MSGLLPNRASWSELGDPDGLDELESLIAELLETGGQETLHKEIKVHDAVWGTCAYATHEAALIDTPLLQRLRRIKQLGGTHAVFPSAVHTRFEHTLGVAHFAGRYTQALCDSGTAIDSNAYANIRLAALLHDVGHGPLSHSSELALGKLAPLPQVLKLLPGCNPAEAFSWLIVVSAPMREFVDTLNRRYGIELDCDFIAGMIVGRLPASQRYLSEILHGPIDADKIDYLQRDGLFAGIPVKLDCDRMLASIEVAEEVADGGGKTLRLTGSDGGAMAFYQLLQHKVYLHAVAYHHSAVRCHSAMFSAALDAAMRDGTPLAGRPLACAADLLRLDDSSLLACDADGSAACRLLEALKLRRLHKVAYAWEGEQASDIGHAIAAKLNLEPEDVLVAAPTLPSFSEARTLLVRGGSELQSLGDIIPPGSWAAPLKRSLGNHLVLCPEHLRMQVRAEAQAILDA